jgi:predicted RND superfamily exporter protein
LNVSGVLSAVDLVDAAIPASGGDTSAPTADPTQSALAALRANPQLELLLAATLTRDQSAARVSITVPMAAASELEPLFAQAVAEAGAIFPEAQVWLTGAYPLVLRSQHAVLRTMLVSLALTFGVVAALFGLLLRSRRGLSVALIPNLLPVVFVLGLMGWFAVPIDGTTLMIAAVVLGLAVDDTLHTLGAFRRRATTLGAGPGAVAALEHTAAGHLLSTATLAAGFLLCGLSEFVPVARFGRLTAVALLMGLLADLLLVPALLATLRPDQISSLSRSPRSPSVDGSGRAKTEP